MQILFILLYPSPKHRKLCSLLGPYSYYFGDVWPERHMEEPISLLDYKKSLVQIPKYTIQIFKTGEVNSRLNTTFAKREGSPKPMVFENHRE